VQELYWKRVGTPKDYTPEGLGTVKRSIFILKPSLAMILLSRFSASTSKGEVCENNNPVKVSRTTRFQNWLTPTGCSLSLFCLECPIIGNVQLVTFIEVVHVNI